MTGQQKVTNEQVRKALEEWGGNLSAAAEALGMRPKNLRERAARLGIDLDALRAKRAGTYDPYGSGTGRDGGVIRTGPYVPGPYVSRSPYGPKSASGPLSGGARPTIVPAMPATMAKEETDNDVAPVRGISGPAKQIRVKPGYQERLREAKVDLISRFRIDTDEQHVFEQFFEEAFEAWLQSKLEPPPAAPAKRKRGDKGESE